VVEMTSNKQSNEITCTYEEFLILRTAFEAHGVIVRMIARGKDGVIFQIINPYKEFWWDQLTGETIKKLAETEIANGY
jgi:hypothetical protein